MFGGSTTSSCNTNGIEVYDINSNSWKKLDIYLTKRLSGLSTVINPKNPDKILIFGGSLINESEILKKVMVFDTLSEKL